MESTSTQTRKDIGDFPPFPTAASPHLQNSAVEVPSTSEADFGGFWVCVCVWWESHPLSLPMTC